MDVKQANRIARHFRFLQEVPEHSINMRYYWSKRNTQYHGFTYIQAYSDPTSTDCDTAACVAGWMPVSFPGQWSNVTAPLYIPPNDEISARAYAIWEARGGDGEENWKAAVAELTNNDRFGPSRIMANMAGFFGTTIDDMIRLCMPFYYRNANKRAVLDRMIETAKAYNWDISTGVALPI